MSNVTNRSLATATAKGLVSGEESGSFSVSVTGPASVSTTCYYSRVGKSVTLAFPSIAGGTSGSSTFATLALTNMPATLRPFAQCDLFIKVYLGSTDYVGFLRVPTTGDARIYRDVSAASFTSGSAWGTAQGISVSYVTA